MKLRPSILTVMLVATLTSCSSEADDSTTITTPKQLQVTAEIDDIRTRLNADGNGFVNNDIIYIMDAETSDVYQYVYGKDEKFASTNPVLLENGEKTLYAFYSVGNSKPTVTEGKVSVSATDQASTVTDILVSKEAKKASATMTQVTFQFRHVMSKLVLNLPEGTTSCSISGLNTAGDVSLTDGTFSNLSGNDVTVALKLDDNKAEGCIIPQNMNDGFTVSIVCNQYSYATTLPLTSPKAGERYTYTLKTGYKSQLLVGSEEEINGFQSEDDELNFTTQLIQQ